MLSTELKINGTPIGTLYGHREPEPILESGSMYFMYYWEYHAFGKGVEGLKTGVTKHRYTDGLEVLVHKILGELTE